MEFQAQPLPEEQRENSVLILPGLQKQTCLL